jgi:hypothetical protein
MKLTEEQLAEIRVYIFGTPRYRETYYELYDHTLNALEPLDEPFHFGLVKHIVEEDFGGFEGIVNQEVVYQKSITTKYNRLLNSEMLNFYKTSTVFSTIALLFIGYLFYDASLTSEINLKPMSVSMLVISMVPGAYYLFKRFVLDRNKMKLSIKYDFLHKCMILGFLAANFLNALFIYESSLFPITYHQKVIVLIVMMVGLNMYIRSFKNVYNKRIKIFAV